ncbi:unnamed protein product [Arabidopsis thaliana]|uniref:Uncharacterized protein n=1 Tax=Arabidopsis thaliana TaxID=3702 RepID=A0A654G7E3_ARATH|nr:unnamed protein product [Arabidopsis thaliana]
MTKNTALTIFMVVLVIGMLYTSIFIKYSVRKDRTCHVYIKAENCEIDQCNWECGTKYKGVGVQGSCVPPGFDPIDQACLCSFNC